MRIDKIIVLAVMLLAGAVGMAQMPGGKSVEVSHRTQVVGGKRYFVHVVDQGQTVYAISRAYGVKEIEAVTKKDIHFLQIGDTVWLPCKGQRLSDGTTAPQASAASGIVSASDDTQTKNPAAPAAAKAKNAQKGADNKATADEKGNVPPAVIRPRVSAQSLVISLMMPLSLSQMDKISTSKFDVEQRGKVSYKSLEFIQFYEGLLLGLERLEQQGMNITLNVVDVDGTTDEAVEQAFRSHQVAQSDLLIAMLTRQPFQKAAALAREAHLFIVNPVSDRSEVVEGNPYVFKCIPSCKAEATAIVQTLAATMPATPIYIMQSRSKNERAVVQALQQELESRPELHCSFVDWSSSTKFFNTLRNNSRVAVISVYDMDKTSNRIYVSQLLNKLAAFKQNTPVLFTFDDWSEQYGDVDFSQLQQVSYHTFHGGWDPTDSRHKAFIDLFADRYKTEPTAWYAGMANDIILYFATGLRQRGTSFFSNPNIACPEGMLYPLSFSHTSNADGFENQSAVLYRMTDYHFNPVQ